MNNMKQTLKITSIGTEVNAILTTEWEEPGTWSERDRVVWGLIPRRSRKALSFFSMVEAQNFADEIGATFIGMEMQQ